MAQDANEEEEGVARASSVNPAGLDCFYSGGRGKIEGLLGRRAGKVRGDAEPAETVGHAVSNASQDFIHVGFRTALLLTTHYHWESHVCFCVTLPCLAQVGPTGFGMGWDGMGRVCPFLFLASDASD